MGCFPLNMAYILNYLKQSIRLIYLLRLSMLIQRYSKILCVLAVAFFCIWVSWETLIDYQIKLSFTDAVFKMDKTFPKTIKISVWHHLGYIFIIVLETFTACFCGWGSYHMWYHRWDAAKHFHRSKKWAIVGLTLGFLTCQLRFMAMGREWFERGMAQIGKGTQSDLWLVVIILAVMIYTSLEDPELDSNLHPHLLARGRI
jgi:predicted small integral membrane protein